MRLTIHESVPPEWWEQCAKVASWFDRDHPAPHRDAIYSGPHNKPDALMFYVTRTKAGGMAVRAWRDEEHNAKRAAAMKESKA